MNNTLGPRIGRRDALRLLGAAGMGFLVSCSPLGTGSQSAAGPATKSGSSQPKSGGTLHVGLAADIGSLDGHGIQPIVLNSIWPIFDTLTIYDANLQPQPLLAESWDVSSDFKQAKLNLRKGVKFHTGREFTSADVKWNILRVRDPKIGASQLLSMSNWFASVDTPDKYTVVLKSDTPRPALFDFLEYLNIQDSETLEGPDATNKAVGTGPFKFVEWIPADHITLAKNSDYWQSGRPYLDQLLFKIIPDAQTLMVQLETGTVDMVVDAPLDDYVRLQKDSQYTEVTNPQTGQYYMMALNVASPMLKDKRARQALNYAIDRSRIVSTVLKGVGSTRSLPWPIASPAYEAQKNGMYSFDLDKAKSLLTQAGVSGGELDIIFLSSPPQLNSIAQIYQSDLAKIGIKLNVKQVEPSVRGSLMNSKQFGIVASTSGYASLEPVSLFSMSAYFNPNNVEGFQDNQFTQLVGAAASEPDAAKRKQIYSQINDLLLDQAFVIPLAEGAPIAIGRANVHDVKYSRHEAVRYTDAWIG